MTDLDTTREVLSRQLAEAVAADPIGTVPVLVSLQKEIEEQLREAVRQAAVGSSWRQIADGLGVSKQAAHQRFKSYAKAAASEMKSEHRAMKRAQRKGDAVEAANARARRDDLAAQLRTNAKRLKDELRSAPSDR
jgi:hypothetical protein